MKYASDKKFKKAIRKVARSIKRALIKLSQK